MKVEGHQMGMITTLETLSARRQRRRFLQTLSLASIGGATALLLPERLPSQDIQLTPPSSLPLRGPFEVGMSGMSDKVLVSGREMTFTLRMKDANGICVVNQCYFRRVDQLGSYVVLATIKSTRGPEPSITVSKIVVGTKGPIQAGVRMDTMEATTVLPSGAIQHDGPLVIPVRIDPESVSRLSVQERFNLVKALDDKAGAQASPGSGVGALNGPCTAFCVVVCAEWLEFPDIYLFCLGACLIQNHCAE